MVSLLSKKTARKLCKWELCNADSPSRQRHRNLKTRLAAPRLCVDVAGNGRATCKFVSLNARSTWHTNVTPHGDFEDESSTLTDRKVNTVRIVLYPRVKNYASAETSACLRWNIAQRRTGGVKTAVERGPRGLQGGDCLQINKGRFGGSCWTCARGGCHRSDRCEAESWQQFLRSIQRLAQGGRDEARETLWTHWAM